MGGELGGAGGEECGAVRVGAGGWRAEAVGACPLVLAEAHTAGLAPIEWSPCVGDDGVAVEGCLTGCAEADRWVPFAGSAGSGLVRQTFGGYRTVVVYRDGGVPVAAVAGDPDSNAACSSVGPMAGGTGWACFGLWADDGPHVAWFTPLLGALESAPLDSGLVACSRDMAVSYSGGRKPSVLQRGAASPVVPAWPEATSVGGASFTIIEGSVWASVRLTQLGTNPEGSELWRWSPGAPAFERVAAVGPERSLSRAVAVGGEVVWVEAARRVDSVPSGRIMATRLAPSGIGTPRVVAELPFWPFGSDSTQDLFAGGEGHVVVFETEAPFDYWPIAANAHVYRLSDGRHWRVPVHASQAWGIAGGELWFASPGAYTDLHRFRLDALGPGD